MHTTILYSLIVLGISFSPLTTAQPTGESATTGQAKVLDVSHVKQRNVPELLVARNLPHSFKSINLDDFENLSNNTDHLTRRTDIESCSFYETTDDDPSCYTFTDDQIRDTTNQVADQFGRMSGQGDCSHYRGKGNDGKGGATFGWESWASNENPSNSDCTTTAEPRTIAGSLQKYFVDNGNKICQVTCFQLNHGGTWRGYISVSPDVERYPPGQYECNLQSAGKCVSGGRYDCTGECAKDA